jgi:integral membrane sensor domain MASE1/anti-sigma regulatory factor (Ser/Thr protein kinase)
MTGQATVRTASGNARPDAALPRLVAAMAAVGLAYYLGARLGLLLSLVEHNVTPLWPPTGIALTAFLLLGRRMWPGVAVAALAVNLPISSSPIAAVATAVGNTAAPFVAALLLERVGFRRQLDRQRDALSIVFLAALASMMISATIGAGSLAASGAIDASELPAAWTVWWTGDAMGVLVIAPFLLCLPLFRELERWSSRRWAEAAGLLVLVSGVSAWAATSHLHVLFLDLPMLGWTAWRLQLRGAAPAALITSLVTTWAATHGRGPFAGESLAEQMFTLQAFNAGVSLTSFFLSALVSERMRTADALAAAAIQQARRDHHIAETLQRSLLPDRLPQVPGVELAARYVPATADVQVGGDWYDVIPLDGGQLALAIGDVAGHGLAAATSMGQLRMAVRAYVLADPSPASVLGGVDRLVAQLPMPEMVTLLYLLFDPDTRSVRYANAGHPPPLVVTDGSSAFLDEVLAPPLGVTRDATFPEGSFRLEPDSTLLLYTDGLIEQRGISLQVGLERLSREATVAGGVDGLCDHLLATLPGPEPGADDIAVLALRAGSLHGADLAMTVSADARRLQEVRRAVERWLREGHVTSDDANDVLVASGEACANVVRHAYPAGRGDLHLEARLDDEVVAVTVRDAGAWRPPVDRGGGWGLELMRGLMDEVAVKTSPAGTVVTMRRRVHVGVAR